MRIINIYFTVTGDDGAGHALGTVTVVLSTRREITYANTRKDQYDDWAAAGYDPSRAPWTMRIAYPRLLEEIEQANAEDETEAENAAELEDADCSRRMRYSARDTTIRSAD